MEEASLRRILTILGARWRLIAAAALPVLVASTAYAVTLPPAYTATSVVSFVPSKGTDAGSSFARLLSPYELTAISAEALSKAELDSGLASGSLHDAVSAEMSDNSLQLTLSVTTPDADDSEAAIHSLTQRVSNATADDSRVTVWNASVQGSGGDQTPLRRAIIVAAGLALALISGGFLVLWLEGSRPRVRLPEDMRTAGIPTLQVLPRRRVLRSDGSWARSVVRRSALSLWQRVSSVLRHPAAESPMHRGTVVVVSLDEKGEEATLIAAGLNRASRSSRHHQSSGQRPLIFRAARLDTLDATAEIAGRHPCVLVVRSGLPQDRLRCVVDLVRSQNRRILGSVFLTR